MLEKCIKFTPAQHTMPVHVRRKDPTQILEAIGSTGNTKKEFWNSESAPEGVPVTGEWEKDVSHSTTQDKDQFPIDSTG